MREFRVVEICPVEGEWLGMRFPCDDEVTHEVTFVCEAGCARPPVLVCEFHARLLGEDDPAGHCADCDSQGVESRIHPAGSRVLRTYGGTDG